VFFIKHFNNFINDGLISSCIHGYAARCFVSTTPFITAIATRIFAASYSKYHKQGDETEQKLFFQCLSLHYCLIVCLNPSTWKWSSDKWKAPYRAGLEPSSVIFNSGIFGTYFSTKLVNCAN